MAPSFSGIYKEHYPPYPGLTSEQLISPNRTLMKPITILSLLTFALASVDAKNAEAASAVIKASKNNFKDLINSKEPVLVEFFAPCK